MTLLSSLPEAGVRNSVFHTMYSRRATRSYLNRRVPRPVIEQLIDAGKMAPSAINLQPYRLLITDDPEKIKRFSAAIVKAGESFFHLAHGISLAATEDPIFYHAPVVVFLIGPEEDPWAAMDIGMCAENIMLAAKSIGLDTCPIGFATLIAQTPVLPELKLEEKEKVYLALTIGYGDDTPVFHGRRDDNVSYL